MKTIILTSCTASKHDRPMPAGQLYTGRQHKAVMEGVAAFRAAGFEVEVWIVSAGLGLVSESKVISPYDETFSGQVKATIQAMGHALELPADVAKLLAGTYGLAIIALGRDYMLACDFGDQLELGGTTIAVVTHSTEDLIPDASKLTKALIAPGYAKALGGQVAAKGTFVKMYLELLIDHQKREKK